MPLMFTFLISKAIGYWAECEKNTETVHTGQGDLREAFGALVCNMWGPLRNWRLLRIKGKDEHVWEPDVQGILGGVTR